MGSIAFMSQYQQKPYPPRQGKVRCGSFFVTSPPDAVAAGHSPYSMFIGQIPEEQFVLKEVFDEGSVPSGAPPIVESSEDWYEKVREIRRIAPAN